MRSGLVRSLQGRVVRPAVVAAAICGAFGVIGCASEPKEPPPRSVDQIRGDSDRMFDGALKREERERGKGPGAPTDQAAPQEGR